MELKYRKSVCKLQVCHSVLWCVVVCCGVLRGVKWCHVVWCGVRKALLPKGNGRDVYPRLHVDGRAVCVVSALCVSVLSSAESGGKGETSRPSTRRWLSAQELPRDSLSFRVLVQV